jgi:hypothetical protein
MANLLRWGGFSTGSAENPVEKPTLETVKPSFFGTLARIAQIFVQDP